jgi:hypothetical protein
MILVRQETKCFHGSNSSDISMIPPSVLDEVAQELDGGAVTCKSQAS